MCITVNFLHLISDFYSIDSITDNIPRRNSTRAHRSARIETDGATPKNTCAALKRVGHTRPDLAHLIRRKEHTLWYAATLQIPGP